MGPKKQKAQPKNAFFYFMLDVQENSRPRVRNLRQAADVAGPMWATMSPQQRAPYEERANKEKSQQQKLNSLGIPIADELSREQAHISSRRSIELEIDELVQSLADDPYNKLAKHKFYFIHLNCFVRTIKAVVVPAEIGISEFSLSKGITDVYSTFLNIAPIPQGYCQEAKDVANKTHKIPVPPFSKIDRDRLDFPSEDPTEVVSIIRRFILGLDRDNQDEDCGHVSLPPLFCVSTEIDIVRECLACLVKESRLPFPQSLRVFPLDNLFFHLQRVTASLKDTPGLPSLALAIEEMDKDRYNYTPNISCLFHEDEDVAPFCSRSKVRRWGYIISDFCCKDLDIDLVDLSHCPPNSKRSHFVESQQNFSTGWDIKPKPEIKGGWGRGLPKPDPNFSSAPPGFPPLGASNYAGAQRKAPLGGMPRPSAEHYASDDDDENSRKAIASNFPALGDGPPGLSPEPIAGPSKITSPLPLQPSTSPRGGYIPFPEARPPALTKDGFGIHSPQIGQFELPSSRVKLSIFRRDTAKEISPPDLGHLGVGRGTIRSTVKKVGSSKPKRTPEELEDGEISSSDSCDDETIERRYGDGEIRSKGRALDQDLSRTSASNALQVNDTVDPEIAKIEEAERLKEIERARRVREREKRRRRSRERERERERRYAREREEQNEKRHSRDRDSEERDREKRREREERERREEEAFRKWEKRRAEEDRKRKLESSSSEDEIHSERTKQRQRDSSDSDTELYMDDPRVKIKKEVGEQSSGPFVVESTFTNAVKIKQEPVDPEDTPYPDVIHGVKVKTEPTSDDDVDNVKPFKLIKIDIPEKELPFRLIRLDLPK